MWRLQFRGARDQSRSAAPATLLPDLAFPNLRTSKLLAGSTRAGDLVERSCSTAKRLAPEEGGVRLFELNLSGQRRPQHGFGVRGQPVGSRQEFLTGLANAP